MTISLSTKHIESTSLCTRYELQSFPVAVSQKRTLSWVLTSKLIDAEFSLRIQDESAVQSKCDYAVDHAMALTAESCPSNL